jgi:hypothetical protein
MSARRVVELHVEELVLDGLGSVDQARVGEAVRGEMAALLAERGLRWQPAEPLEIAHLDGGTVRVRDGFAAEALGRRVARALFRSIPAVQQPVGRGGNDALSESPQTLGSEQVGKRS